MLRKFNFIKEIKRFKNDLEEEINKLRPIESDYYTGLCDAYDEVIDWLNILLDAQQFEDFKNNK